MKTNTIYFFLMILTGLISSCTDQVYETFKANSPVYMSYDKLRSSVKTDPAQELHNPGKIYFKDQYIFINEKMEGVHVFDVSDPSNPKNVTFIEIPGNMDIAIKDNILYADSYVDLVSLDISDLSNITETGRVEKVFPYTLPEYNTDYPVAQIDEDKGVVTGWDIKNVRQKVERRVYPIYYAKETATLDAAYSGSSINGATGSTYGVGGSMARFGLYKNMLYVTDQYNLYTFKLNSSSDASLENTSNVGWNMETMFITDDHMFLGTQNGMMVMSLEVPEQPAWVGSYSHITSCDPVVIKDDLAYVTLHGGTTCRGGTVNELDVIRMSDGYTKFNLLKSYPMNGPLGLGVDGDLLFICDGNAGLKIYNSADPLTITQNKISEFTSVNAYDVIPLSNYLFMIGDKGFMLYDYSSIQDIKQIGFIPVVKFFAD